MFVGREKELTYLETMYQSKKAEMIVLYGRRRIGKTELIKQFIQDKRYIFYSASEVDDNEQLRRLSQIVMSELGFTGNMKFDTWDELFKSIEKINGTEKLILVIDEFPYMVNGNKAIPSLIQNLWDHNLKSMNLMIILSGSSMGVMYDEILGANNPLYGRISGSYKLEELPYNSVNQFFSNYTPEERLAAYAILGGVPEYLITFDDQMTLRENIVKHILTKGSRLYDEVNLLMKQELREATTYYTILEAIALGKTKLNEIHQYTLIEKTKIVTYITKLIGLGVVEREHPVTEKLKKKVNVNTGLYKIKNNLFRFYFCYILPNTSLLELGNAELVYDHIVEKSLNEFISIGYEQICRDYLMYQNVLGRLPFLGTVCGRYWHKDAEIDVMLIGINEEMIFGECKWRNEVMKQSVLKKLENKIEAHFSQKENKGIYLFSKSGFTPELEAYARECGTVSLVDSETLCKV